MHGKKQRRLLITALLIAAAAPPVMAEDAPVPIQLSPPKQEQPASSADEPKLQTPPEAPKPADAPQPQKPAQQTEAPKPSPQNSVVVRVGQHEGYDRVVFDWPHNVSYKVARTGDAASIHFAEPGTVQLSPTKYLTRGHDFAASIDTDGHLTVSFHLDAKASLKDFFSGPSIALDIMAVPGHEAAKPADAEKPKEAKVTPPPARPAAATPAQAVPASLSVPEVKAAQPPQASATPAAPAAEVVPNKETPASVQPSPPPPTAPTVQTAGSPPPDVGTEPVLAVSLDPHISTRAVVWARGGYGYIVFDRRFTLGVDALTAGLPAPVVQLQPLDLPKASGFRFKLADKTEVHATRSGNVWKIFLSRQQLDVPVSATLVAQPDFALGARYLLPLPDAPEPVHIVDPVIGDDLILVPLNQTQAFSVKRRMVDFEIYPAAQGLVIKPLTDKLIVRAVSDGIEITAEAGGLHMSSSQATGAAQQSAQKARSAMAGKSIFDFATWRGKSGETFTDARQRQQQTVVDVPDRERDRARLELARFYFARGYGEEASALLAYIAKDIPDLPAHADFLALSGAAKILAHRPEEGLKDFAAANFTDQPEIKLWQGVAYAELRNWTEAEDQFASSEALLAGYPEPFFSRFFILAVESALAADNSREASEWLEVLHTNPHNPDIDAAIDYLQGVLHAKAGRATAASAAWKRVVASNDRLYKVRAELALIDLGVANLSLSPAQAADRLEALRFGWRGDDLEVDILHRLGQFYIKAKNVKAGLAALSQAVQLYPHSPFTPKIHDEMSQTFHDIFLGDLGKSLSPLEALSLYQQYRDLMPQGEEGIAVTRNLAERLAAIDLMDQAANLLEDLAKNKLTGVEKGRVVARLAALRLLDHKPEVALDALDLSANDALTQNLQIERELLRAKALSQLHREDEALVVLKDDNRFPAKLLRADINMSAQHWEEAAKTLLDIIGPPPKPGQQLRDDQADWLVRCAVAMAMNGDQIGLDHLAIDYGAAMAGTPQNNTFRVLVQPEMPGQMRDITSAQNRISEVDMFQGFLDAFRKSDDVADQAATQEGKKP